VGIEVVDAAHPVARFGPNRRSVSGADPRSAPIEIVTNNVGYRNDLDYESGLSTPLLALVGDSYVAAAMVPFEQTLAARLTVEAGSTGRVYSFAVRGAGLSQYLVWAAYARDEFEPSAYAFVVVANDFGDSLHPRPGFHSFDRRPNGESALVRADHHRSLSQWCAAHSAVAAFVRSLRPVLKPPPDLTGKDGPSRPAFVSNIPAKLPEETLEEYRWAFDAFVERLPEATGTPYDRILFVVDGLRPDMYEPQSLAYAKTSAWAELRDHVITSAGAVGIEVVDLDTFFTVDYEQHGRPFEFEHDNHWNGYGHGVVADATAGSRVFQESVAPQ
jgi:hypothetical protein